MTTHDAMMRSESSPTPQASMNHICERRILNSRLVVAGLIATSALAAFGGRWVDVLAGSGLGMALLALPREIARDAVDI